MNITGTHISHPTGTPITQTDTTDLSNDLEELRSSLRELGRATDRCVRHYAWASVGLAAALGICVGLLMGGSSGREN